MRRNAPPLYARVNGRAYRFWAARTIRTDLLRRFGEGSIVHPPALVIGHRWIEIGDGVVVHPGAFLSVVVEAAGERYDPRLAIGDGVTLGFDAVIACCGSVVIEDHVLTADRVFIGDTFHEYRDVRRPVIEQGLRDPRPVRIGRGAFLGINSVVLPGVTLGEGAYVGANAVVTADVPAHAVVVGNPARVVKRWDGTSWQVVDRAQPRA
jgi:carbonic anhydrase/acetyltransferase-like protein (isoleucine patch superfamily)